MADAPIWARALVATACAEADAPLPRLRWRSRSRPTSSGVTRRHDGTISLVAGTDVVDQRLTLLHELAHWLVPAPTRRRRPATHHDRAFYRMAFALHARHGIPAEVALAGESARYPSSLRHARALQVTGAEEAWSRRRAELRAVARTRAPWSISVPEHRIRLVRDGRWTRCQVCGVRVVGPTLQRIRRRGGSHVLYARGQHDLAS